MAPKKPKTPRGLNKKEKSEVKKIALAQTLQVAEKKYTNTLPSFNVVPNTAKPTSRISVLGFCNTTNVVGTGLNTAQHYGIDDPTDPTDFVEMRELKMLRPFTSTSGSQQTDAYALEGRECQPVSASCKWRFSRDIGKIVSGLEAANWNTNLGAPNGLQHNLPIIVRMIRVNPKLLQQNVVCDPAEDLFVGQYNSSIGINSSAFDDLELLTYRVNKRRYNVIEDKFFRIQNGLTVSYQRSNIHNPDTTYTGGMLQPFISNTNSNCEKVINTSHQLTAKKMKPVFYDVPDSNALQTATTGAKKEYILFHMMYAGAETYLDNVGVTQKCPLDLKISAIPMTKFTDS